ncbi:MAG: YggT family protein [Gammaproteobacteria bacterium]|nr:YggT family protein [Gammaproteobacteria bacterium]
MQSILSFLVSNLFSLLYFVFLLRLMMQWTRADFRNPIGQSVLQMTNWLIQPLRRILPSRGQLDNASIAALLAIALLKIGILHLIFGMSLPEGLHWLLLPVFDLLNSGLSLYFWAIFIYALLSMIAPGIQSPLQSLLESLCEPVLDRIRQAIPNLAGVDLSPLWAGLILQVLIYLIKQP